MYHLTCENYWGSHREESTTDIFWKMLESQMTPGTLCLQGRQLKELCNSMHISGTEITTSDLLVRLSLPVRSVYRGFMTTAPAWEGHGIQIGLELENLLCALRTIFFNFQASWLHTMITIALSQFR